MKQNHITDLLDKEPLASLSEQELAAIREHVKNCTACAGAYQAAQLSELLVKERVAEITEPSPFFHTRVMAAWREQQATNQGSVFARWWKPARALVSALALTTAALAALTFTIPESASQPAVETIAESTVLGVENEGQMTEDQMLSSMYVDEEEAP